MSTPSAHDVQTLRDTWEQAGQGHVFTFWDQLSPSEQTTFYRQLVSINPARVNGLLATALQAEQDAATSASADEVSPPPADQCGSVIGHPEQAAEWNRIGLDAIRAGKVAVVLMAGGQGTRLGSSAPKGCYDIGLASHKSLFQLQAERIRRLERLAAGSGAGADAEAATATVPWYIMTSGPTRKPTEEFFAAHDFFGLDRRNVVFFEQGVLPCLSNEGKIFLDTPSSIAVAPDGNGGIYAALRAPLSSSSSSSSTDALTTTTTTTVLSDLAARGIEYIHAYGVDNCLVRVADPVLMGYCIARNADCGVKVVKKTDPTESVGVVALRRDKFAVVEYSEISREMAHQREDVDRPSVGGGTEDEPDLVFRAANIANHFYTRAFLTEVCALDESLMPFHLARKKIPHVDLASTDGARAPPPTRPNGLKLEQFVFDVFPFLQRFALLEVERSSEFSPLKNPPGTGADDPQTSVRDLRAEHRRWLIQAGAKKVAGGVEVEISPLVSYAGEGLEQAVRGREIVRSGVVHELEDLQKLMADAPAA